MLVELCIDNYEGALIASKLGYDSVEVNSSLFLGGLTPTLGLVKSILENLNIDTMVMIRNRAGGFCYTDAEYDEMKRELSIFLKEDITGIVFGFLDENFEINTERTKEFIEQIHKSGKKAIFHRAFDNTADPAKSIKLLIELGIDRVLTSGQKSNAIEGRDTLKYLIENYGDKIEIICGSGLNSDNIMDFIEFTGTKLVHSSCKEYRRDITTVNNVSYAFLNGEREKMYQITSYKESINFIRKARKIDK